MSRALLILGLLLVACEDETPQSPASDTASAEDSSAEDTRLAVDTEPATDSSTAPSDVGTDGGDTAPEQDTSTGVDTAIAQDTRADAADASLEGFACSADLREVIGIAGQVLGECPPDQGCAEGRCVPACDAASASEGSIGCDFRVATAPSYPPALPPCHAVFLANTWEQAAQVRVYRGSTEYDVSQFARIPENGKPPSDWLPLTAAGIPADGVAILFLSSDPNAVMPETGTPLTCPVTPAINASTALLGSGESDLFRIETTVPVSAYDMLPYGGAPSFFPSAQLLLPTPVWSEQYVVIGTPPGTHSTPGPLWLEVAALEDNTTIEVIPSVNFPAAGPALAIQAGATGSFPLDAERYVQWEVGTADPSGTIIVADKPVAVMTGSRFFRLQNTPGPGGEATHQQILPARALSQTYVIAPYTTRRKDLADELVHYRVVGAFDGTQLTYDPAVPGAPATLERGQVVDFTATGAFILESQDDQHPFAVAQIMKTANLTGGSREGALAQQFCSGGECPLGDEEFVIVFPPAQYLKRYVFFTDPTYSTTNLVFVRTQADFGFAPINIDCYGEVTGWQPVGTSGLYEYASVDLVRGNLASPCTNGRHLARSEAPFGLVVWGLDTYASYAYPAGGNASTLADLPPLN